MVPVDVQPISVTEICFRELSDKLRCTMATMLGKICRVGSQGFMGIMVCVDTTLHPMEEEVVGREPLGVRLSNGTEVLSQKSLREDAFHLAAQCLSVPSVAVSYAVGPLPPMVPSPEGRNKSRVGLRRPLRMKDTLILGEDQGS